MIATRIPRFLLVVLVCVLALAPQSGQAGLVTAATLTFTVNSTADAPDAHPGDGICADSTGRCTVRAAVQEADAQPLGSRITINVPAGTYGLTLGTLQLTANDIAISGALSSTTIISGNNTFGIMAISSGVNATLSQFTITGGTAPHGGGGIRNSGLTVLSKTAVNRNTSGYFGGGISNVGTLTVTNSTLSGNSAHAYGGGIENGGTLTVTSSTLRNNSASKHDSAGGGIYNVGMLTVTNSTLSSNTAGLVGGGGIYSDAMLIVTSSTLSHNSAIGGGGGINNPGANVSVSNSTLSGNSAGSGGGISNGRFLSVSNSTLSGNSASSPFGGGGISNINGTATVIHSTLSGNSANVGGGILNGCSGSGCYPTTVALSYVTITSNSDGIDNVSGSVALKGSIVANSTTGPNCTGAMTEGHGYNLDSGTSCGFSKPTDITNQNPLLGPLANNGGPTQTMALLHGSPAIDYGGTHTTGCPATDQRGMPRPDEAKDNGACDVGAYESQGIG